MRTVWDHEIVDLKLALNQLYKDDREALEAYVSERMKSIIKRGGEPKFSGVTFTSRKEAY